MTATERVVVAGVLAVVAGVDPLLLWAAGRWPFHYAAPGWAYVALWLIVVDIYIGVTSWRKSDAPAGSSPIDEAMIDRGLREMYGDRYIDSLDADWRIEKEHAMRSVLAAALTTEGNR